MDRDENLLRKLEDDLGGFLSLLVTSGLETLHRLGNVEDKVGKCILFS